MSNDWDSLSRSEKKEEAHKTLHMLKRQRAKMNWKEILGGIISIIYIMSTIYQLLNWDSEYWDLVGNITFAILGLSMVIEGRKKSTS